LLETGDRLHGASGFPPRSRLNRVTTSYSRSRISFMPSCEATKPSRS
jgi:hypothetical protein